MDLSKSQRDDLAMRVKRVRIDRFRGNRRAAYTEAGVNALTWTKAEEGRPLAERSLVAIVSTLWPETGGDWMTLDPPLGTDVDPEREIINSPLSPATKEYALRLLREDRERSGSGEVKGA